MHKPLCSAPVLLFDLLLAGYVVLPLRFIRGPDMAAAAAGAVCDLSLPLKDEFAFLTDIDHTFFIPPPSVLLSPARPPESGEHFFIIVSGGRKSSRRGSIFLHLAVDFLESFPTKAKNLPGKTRCPADFILSFPTILYSRPSSGAGSTGSPSSISSKWHKFPVASPVAPT